jgi:hypothetical protein
MRGVSNSAFLVGNVEVNYCQFENVCVAKITNGGRREVVPRHHRPIGAIIGVGAVHRLTAVRWGLARQIVWASVLTIPASAFVSAVSFWIIRLIHPDA